MPKRKQPIISSCSGAAGWSAVECDGESIFIVFNGERIAKRGRFDSPQAKTWVSLEPGWTVLDEPDGIIAIVHEGVRVH